MIDIRSTAADNGRIVGNDNSHGQNHRHRRAMVESVEFDSYEDIEQRFEDEVRKYIDEEEG